MPLEVRPLAADAHLAFVTERSRQLPADPGLGPGQGRVGQRAARLVRRRPAGRRRAGAAAADPAGPALPRLPARGPRARLVGVRRRRRARPRCSRRCGAAGAFTREDRAAAGHPPLVAPRRSRRRSPTTGVDRAPARRPAAGRRPTPRRWPSATGLRGLGWRQDAAGGAGFGDFQPRYVFQLPLAGRTEADLLAGFNQLWRRNIRKADKDGVEVTAGHGRRPAGVPPALPRDRGARRLHPAAARATSSGCSAR